VIWPIRPSSPFLRITASYGRDASHGNLSQAFDAGSVEFEMRLVDELYLDQANVGVFEPVASRGQVIFGSSRTATIDTARLATRFSTPRSST
jgi:hypothetical protein